MSEDVLVFIYAFFSLTGCILFYMRIVWPIWAFWLEPKPISRTDSLPTPKIKVTVIIPARNEENNLGACLQSLKKQTYPYAEICVVDDQSTDRTKEIANAHHVTVIDGQERPSEWTGKSWACHQGAQLSSADFLLFTDADTIHDPLCIERLVFEASQKNIDLLSCLPFHLCPTWWEKLMGPFHLFLIFATAPYQNPSQKRLYANGQLLFFRRSYYEASGGHAAIRSHLAEDIHLARQAILTGAVYRVITNQVLYRVRMYSTFSDFISGWQRNFRLGLRFSNLWATAEIILLFCALLGTGHLLEFPVLWSIATALLVGIVSVQKRFGQFSILGAAIFPLSLSIFVYVTTLSMLKNGTNRPHLWKSRAYDLY